MVKQNINLYLASPRGFCAGVDRAVKIVEQAIKKFGSPIYVRHEIVHNKDVVKSLENLGAIFVDEITDAPENSTIIFSAHGVPKSVFINAKKRKMLSIDATCPLVTKVHNETIKHFNSHRKILLIGHKNHPEVVGTMGQVPNGNVILIENLDEAKVVNIEETNTRILPSILFLIMIIVTAVNLYPIEKSACTLVTIYIFHISNISLVFKALYYYYIFYY